MSGGRYNYKCFEISEFSRLLKGDFREFKKNEDYKFSKKTISNLKKAQKIIEATGNLAYQVEWLMSGDTGENDFNKEFKKELKKLK